MNPAYIQDIITMLKEDKSCIQPWRNYAIKALNEAIAFVEKGQRSTNLQPPGGMETANKSNDALCTCPLGGIRSNCPVHGTIK